VVKQGRVKFVVFRVTIEATGLSNVRFKIFSGLHYKKISLSVLYSIYIIMDVSETNKLCKEKLYLLGR